MNAKTIVSKDDEPLRSLIRSVGILPRERILDYLWDDSLAHALRNGGLFPQHMHCVMYPASVRQKRSLERFLEMDTTGAIVEAAPVLREWSFRELHDFSVVTEDPEHVILVNRSGERSWAVRRDWLGVKSVMTLRKRLLGLGNFHWVGRDSDLELFQKRWGL